MDCVAEFAASDLSSGQAVGVCGLEVAESANGTFLAAGTLSGEALITEIDFNREMKAAPASAGASSGSDSGALGTEMTVSVSKPVRPVAGHSQGRLRALATHPSRLLAATGGDDGFVTIWDVRFPKVLGTISAASGISSLAFHPAGDQLAIGLGG